MRRATLFLAIIAVILTALLGIGATTDGTETGEAAQSAAPASTDNVKELAEDGAASLIKPLTVQVKDAAADEAYDITVEWGSLKFDYVKSQGVYEEATGEWTHEDGADTIVITNNSTVGVVAQFEYYPVEPLPAETDLNVSFLGTDGKPADNKPIASNDTESVHLVLSGEVAGDAADEAATFGNVMLTLMSDDSE